MADRPPPSLLATIVATAVLAGISGYMIGIASSLGFLPIPFSSASRPQKTGKTAGYDNEEESSEEEIDGDESALDHAPNWSGSVVDAAGGATGEIRRRGGLGQGPKKKVEEKKQEESKLVKEEAVKDTGEECKLVLVVRTDLGMTKGKIAAQASHATLACFKTLSRSKSPAAAALLKRWEKFGQAKIAVQVKSEDELLTLQAVAASLGVTAEVIADAGRTQIESGSLTVLGVGPAPKSVVDKITGGLKLL